MGASLEDLQARSVTCDAVSKLVREDHIQSAFKTLLFRRRFKQHLHKQKGEFFLDGISRHKMRSLRSLPFAQALLSTRLLVWARIYQQT
jgi:hypothetical protein